MNYFQEEIIFIAFNLAICKILNFIRLKLLILFVVQNDETAYTLNLH